MTVLYMILGLFALVALLLLCSLTLTLDYDKKFTAKVGFLGFKITIGKEKSEKKKKKAAKKAKKKSGAKEPGAFAKRFKDNSFSQNVRLVIDILRDVMPQIKYVLSRTRVRDLILDIRVATPDAAKTALEYGGVCSAVYPFLSWAEGFLDISMKKVDITAAFGEEKSSARAHVKFKLRVIILLIAVFKLLPVYQKLTEDVNNERKKHKFNN